MTFLSLFYVTFESLTPTFVFSESLSFTIRPIFGPTPTICQFTYNDVQPPNFPLTEVSPLTFMSSQKACPSLYHPVIRLCFNKTVRRNIHFSVISHSLCNRTVMLFAVMSGVKLHITFLVIYCLYIKLFIDIIDNNNDFRLIICGICVVFNMVT